MLKALQNFVSDVTGPVQAPDKLRLAMKAAQTTNPPAARIKRFPIDSMVTAAANAANRVVDAEGELMRAELAAKRRREEDEELLAALKDRLDDAERELVTKQCALARELYDVGAFTRLDLNDLKTVLAHGKARSEGTIQPDDYVPTVRLDNGD